jgi:hypothetical protein
MNGCQKHGPNNAAETSKIKTIWERICVVGPVGGEERSDPHHRAKDFIADVEVACATLRSDTMIGSQRSSDSQRYSAAVGAPGC